MTQPGFTWDSYLQFNREGSWGGFPTINKRVPIYGCTVRQIGGRIRPRTMDGTMDWPNVVQGMEACEIEIEMPLLYTGQLLLWDLIMGTDTYGSNGGSTSGAGPYVHTWARQKKLLSSASFEVVQGDIPSGKCIRVLGAKVSTATIRMASGLDVEDQIARLTLKMLGQSLVENQTPTGGVSSPALSTSEYVMQRHVATLTHPAQAVTTPSSMELTLEIDNQLAAGPFLEGAGTISEPHRKGRPRTTLTIKQVLHVRTPQQNYLANTGGAWQLIVGSGVNRILQLDAGGILEVFPEAPINDEGWIEQELRYTMHDTGSSEHLAVAVTNSQATITT